MFQIGEIFMIWQNHDKWNIFHKLMLNFLPLLQYDSITCDEKQRQEEVEPTSEHPNWSFLDKLLARRQQFGTCSVTLAVWLAHKIQEMVELETLAMFLLVEFRGDFGDWRDSYMPSFSFEAWVPGVHFSPGKYESAGESDISSWLMATVVHGVGKSRCWDLKRRWKLETVVWMCSQNVVSLSWTDLLMFADVPSMNVG